MGTLNGNHPEFVGQDASKNRHLYTGHTKYGTTNRVPDIRLQEVPALLGPDTTCGDCFWEERVAPV